MSDWKIRFGTAGTSDSFAAQGYKSSLDVPEYTAKMGLNAFEYQCGRGVRLGLDKAAKMAALAGPKDILFSVHAPYYISMSSLEEEKRLNMSKSNLQTTHAERETGKPLLSTVTMANLKYLKWNKQPSTCSLCK